jgi:hypothetical protein
LPFAKRAPKVVADVSNDVRNGFSVPSFHGAVMRHRKDCALKVHV